jgi:hypothetical protein
MPAFTKISPRKRTVSFAIGLAATNPVAMPAG